jgi:hypothetical protein
VFLSQCPPPICFVRCRGAKRAISYSLEFGGPLADMSLTAVLRRMDVRATVHGFRSTFCDWISEHTDHPSEVAEMALAHAVGDKVEAAYRRGDLFEKRVTSMNDGADFLSAPKTESSHKTVRRRTPSVRANSE